ncbi:MAG TPA: CTP synthase [Verrucomicrobiae bacterium]|nr:CTP synthase [Verrucomicrobiae bacterium]
MKTTIAIIGDFNPANESHIATQDAVVHASKSLGFETEASWIGTEQVAAADGLQHLKRASGLWIAPASPYRSMEGALRAIHFGRQNGIPLLGTCGGFQHIILEYARNALGIPDARHEEVDPNAEQLVISRLFCSLVGRTGTIQLEPGSKVAIAYGRTTVREQYWCNFGLNPRFVERFQSSGLRIIGRDAEDGAVRAVELADHTFFIGTLFLPQLGSGLGAPHPLIAAFLRACKSNAKTESGRHPQHASTGVTSSPDRAIGE